MARVPRLMPMNITHQNPWAASARHCWEHVNRATEMAELIDKLQGVEVGAVIPLVSVTGPALLVTPVEPANKSGVRELCHAIKSAVETPTKWTAVQSGSSWMFRLKIGAINIDISTEVPATKAVEFLVE